MLNARWIFLAGAALAATACSPYDPDFGDTPFRCRGTVPQCPEGYACVPGDVSATGVCVREGAPIPQGMPDGGGAGDAARLTCNDDSTIESNDNIGEATGTPIPRQQSDYTLRALSVCPAGDLDVFRFEIDVDRRNIRVSVIDTERSRGVLLLEILNAQGVSLTTGAYESETLLVAALPNATRGEWFAQVRGAGSATNNYGITIETFD